MKRRGFFAMLAGGTGAAALANVPKPEKPKPSEAVIHIRLEGAERVMEQLEALKQSVKTLPPEIRNLHLEVSS